MSKGEKTAKMLANYRALEARLSQLEGQLRLERDELTAMSSRALACGSDTLARVRGMLSESEQLGSRANSLRDVVRVLSAIRCAPEGIDILELLDIVLSD